MNHWSDRTFAALVAVLFTLSSIGAIVTMPAAQAHAAPSSPFMVELA